MTAALADAIMDEWLTHADLSRDEPPAFECDGPYVTTDTASYGARGFVAEENRDYWKGLGNYTSERVPPSTRGKAASRDDVVMSLVQRVYDEFYVSCPCTLQFFLNPSQRTIWLVEPRSVMDLVHAVNGFTDNSREIHTDRLLHLLRITRSVDSLPADFDPNGVAAKNFRTYCPRAQFLLVFSVPFTPNQRKRQRLPKNARRRISLEITVPPMENYWDREIHPFLPSGTRKDIENVVQACQGLPIREYEENPFLSMEPPLFHHIFGFMVKPAKRRKTCASPPLPAND
jgi:hypothetical protein